MSLGALDFGLIVDGAVIIVENCLRTAGAGTAAAGACCRCDERLRRRVRGDARGDPAGTVRRVHHHGGLPADLCARRASKERCSIRWRRPSCMALLAAMLLSVTVVPAAVALLIRKPRQRIGRVARRPRSCGAFYAPLLAAALRQRVGVVAGAALLVVLQRLAGDARMGSEFLPSLDEGDIAMHALRIPGTSLTQAIGMQEQLEAGRACDCRRSSASSPRSARRTSPPTRCRRASPTTSSS